jgi:hypothetical protein|eukprot:scaffold3156_cov268-Chaetoceros_neogracile.AAC.20
MQATTQDSSIVIGVEKAHLYDQPIAEGSSFDFSAGLEKRSLSNNSEDERNEMTEKRNSPDTLFSRTTNIAACSSMTSSVDQSTRSLPVVVSPPDRPVRDLQQVTWKSDSCLLRDNYGDEADDMSVASGYSYSTYDTTASSESVQDIISRLQSETERRRRRLMRRRAKRNQEGKSSDMLQKYSTQTSAPIDPKLGIMVEIKE